MKRILLFSLAFVALVGCRKSEFGLKERTSGNADFTNYVAVGNSLTQGYQDGGVYAEGQEQSYPAILAKQMNMVEDDMDDFNQPEVFGNGSGYMHLQYIDGEIEVINANDLGGYSAEGWDDWGTVIPNYYNNLGISGITLMQCVAMDENEKSINNIIMNGASVEFFPPPVPPFEVDALNPFGRFLDWGESPLNGGTPIQYVDHVRNSGATFFTNWLGNNDVLGYATAGGVSQTFDGSLLGLGTVEIGTISDPTVFKMKYDSILVAFKSQGAEGICATIPDVTAIPFFNTFTTQSVKDDFGYTTVWIEDYNDVVRAATDADLILLSAKDTIEMGGGSSAESPLPNNLVLDSWEVGECQAGTMAINAAIRASANQHDYPVLDMHAFVNKVKGGAVFDGVEINADYISGGGFSLDGIHLNPRGYAIVANEFISAINDHYESTIPRVAIANYRGIIYP